MKLFSLFLMLFVFSPASQATQTKVIFTETTVYSVVQQDQIVAALFTYCPAVTGWKRAEIIEQETRVSEGKDDEDFIQYTTNFSFITQEGPGQMGNLVVHSERVPSVNLLQGIRVDLDPSGICHEF